MNKIILSINLADYSLKYFMFKENIFLLISLPKIFNIILMMPTEKKIYKICFKNNKNAYCT